MHEFAEEVADEQIRPEELRALLERLTLSQVGGPENPRVRDVAELAGLSPDSVGRVLAEIRGETIEQWRARFEAALSQHGDRLSALEALTSHELNPVRLYDLAKEGERVREKQSTLAMLLVLGTLTCYCLFGSMCSGGIRSIGPQSDQWSDPKMVFKGNGHWFGYDKNQNWSEAGSNGKPGPIVHQADSEIAKTQMSRSPEASATN